MSFSSLSHFLKVSLFQKGNFFPTYGASLKSMGHGKESKVKAQDEIMTG